MSARGCSLYADVAIIRGTRCSTIMSCAFYKYLWIGFVVAVVGAPTLGDQIRGPLVRPSRFDGVSLREPFTLVYHVEGALSDEGPSESTITLSASHGHLLYYVRSDHDPRVVVAIYNGHATDAYGQLGRDQAARIPGLAYTQFKAMPLPAAGLPYIPISQYDIPPLVHPLRSNGSKLIAQMLDGTEQAVPAGLRSAGRVRQDLELVPLPNASVPGHESVLYRVGTIGWAPTKPSPEILWLAIFGRKPHPWYLWSYSGQMQFKGCALPSNIQFTRFHGPDSNDRSVCTLTLLSAHDTPLTDADYTLEKYISHRTRVDDYTKAPEVVVDYHPGEGSIEDQEARELLSESSQRADIYAGKSGARSNSGIALGLALVFGTATCLLYLKRRHLP